MPLEERWRYFLLPVVILALPNIAYFARFMRSAMLEVIHQDYIRTALATGSTRFGATVRHGLRNASAPVVTIAGLQMAGLIGEAVLVENVMAWPGLGRLIIEAYFSKDMFVVAASVLMGTIMLILGNLLADILLAATDPRIRYE